jgi:TRAP transporter 4TM/12TM fusion protein
MKRVGYSANFAGAVECASSAGGQILPPIMGATAFMMADTLGIPYIKVCKAALLPALLYFIAVFFCVHFRAVRLDLKGGDVTRAAAWGLIKRSYLMLPLFGIVFFLIRSYTPTFSAFWGGIVTALALTFLRKETRITPKKLVAIAVTAAKTAMSLGVATAIVGVVVGCFSLTGISMTASHMIFSFTGGMKFYTLMVTMLVALIIGLGLPTSAAYVLTSISAAPALAMVGIDLMPAHLFVFYYGCMSTITPPVATGAYTAAALSGGNPNMVSLISMRLAVGGFMVPFLFMYQPDLLIGDVLNIPMSSLAFLLSAVGLIYFCAAFEGAFLLTEGIKKRLIYFAVAITLVWPDKFVSFVGMCAAIAILTVDFIQYRKIKKPGAGPVQTPEMPCAGLFHK